MAANTITRGRLRRLAELRPQHGMVLSVFFNLDPSEFATPAARATETNSVVTAAARRVEELEGLAHDERIALRDDVERVKEVLRAPGGDRRIAWHALCGERTGRRITRAPPAV